VFLEALQGFVLVSSQQRTGGLRDKPGKPADAYHTLYNLSGLSSAQHHVHRPVERRQELNQKWMAPPAQPVVVSDPKTSDSVRLELRRKVFVANLAWTEEEGALRYVGGKANRVVSVLVPKDSMHPSANAFHLSPRMLRILLLT
jgi:protein farnesyltransferase subunit beta